MIQAKNDHKVLDAANLFCSSSRSGARVKLGGIRLPQHGFTAPRLEPMFWHLLPALVIGGQVYRPLSLSAQEWIDKKLFSTKNGTDLAA